MRGSISCSPIQRESVRYLPVDYTIEDETTDSGFAETKADVLTVTLAKLPKIESVEDQTEQCRADIDYIAMETGVNV